MCVGVFICRDSVLYLHFRFLSYVAVQEVSGYQPLGHGCVVPSQSQCGVKGQDYKNIVTRLHRSLLVSWTFKELQGCVSVLPRGMPELRLHSFKTRLRGTILRRLCGGGVVFICSLERNRRETFRK